MPSGSIRIKLPPSYPAMLPVMELLVSSTHASAKKENVEKYMSEIT